MSWIKKNNNKLIPSVIYQPNPPIKKTLKLLKKDAIKLDIGAGGRKITSDTIGVDFLQFDRTGVIADIHFLPFSDSSIDCVFSTGTFEHIKNPEMAIKEINRILKVGGIFHIEVPFIQPFHKDPVDYWRWTIDGLSLFCHNNHFEIIENGAHLGPTSALNEILIAYFQTLFNNRYIRKLIDIIFSYLLFVFKYLDILILRREHAFYLASGVFVISKKMAGSIQITKSK